MAQHLVRRGRTGTMAPWDPFRDLDTLYGQMNRWMQDAGGDMAMSETWTPLADLIETDDAYDVEAEVPGVDKKDISIEFSDRQLTVSGEFRTREEAKHRHGTRRSGGFEYRVSLPSDADGKNATADLTNGLLTVHIPKSRDADRHKIDIKI